MSEIRLGYGKTGVNFSFDENRFRVLGVAENEARAAALSDVEIGGRLDAPIDSPPLEEIVRPGETVLIVVPDATREVAAGQIVNLIVRRLIAGGTAPGNIRIIFATGIHRPVTDAEKREIVTPFIAQRVRLLDHDAKDLMALRRFGETAGGIPIELNRALVEHDHVVLVGGVSFHYFAGFGGGRKMVCPGLGSARTVGETHKLAFDCERRTRREGVGLARLAGNAVHEAFVEVVEKIKPSFSVNTIVGDRGEAVEVYAGHWRTAHEQACEAYLARHLVEIPEKRGLVVASCGGAPYDVNMIQAHKALEMAAHACSDGGTIVFLAECADGLGRSDFLKWFEAEDSRALAEVLCEKYQVNGQTAWSLLTKAERFRVRVVTALGEAETSLMRLEKVTSLEEAMSSADPDSTGYILPFGAKFLIRETSA